MKLLETKLIWTKIYPEGQLSLIQKDFLENNLLNDKHFEEFLIEGAVKTTIQILYDKGIFDY